MSTIIKNLLKNNAEKLRFLIIGALNTAIDFSILFILVGVGIPVIFGNFISTSVALTFSFFANKTFTFKNSEDARSKHFVYFLVITLFGLWVIQPIIIEATRYIAIEFIKNNNILLLVGKILATGVTLVWNYLMYRKFVFKSKT